MINKKKDKTQKTKLIIRIIRIIIIIVFAIFLYFELSLFFITKKIFNESYNSYGEQIPQSLTDNIDPEIFHLVNHRSKSKNGISVETNKISIYFIDYRVTKAIVYFKYTYLLKDSDDNLVTHSIDIKCNITYELSNGKWKAVDYSEEP